MADAAAAQEPSTKPPRPTACTACHTAKVKCDKSFPCSRCIRLSKPCIPHVSKQGRGSKKRLRDKNGGTAAVSKPKAKKKQPKPPPTEDALGASATSLRPGHFGLQYLIRSWVSFAFRRRSFSLLAKASTLAARVGITMDSILCGESEGKLAPSMPGAQMVGPMDFLLPCLLKPARHQNLGNNRLRWSELPPDLLSATRCGMAGRGDGSHSVFSRMAGRGDGSDYITSGTAGRSDGRHYFSRGGNDISNMQVCQNIADVATVVEERTEEEFLAPILGSRWVFIREMKEGMSRFFVSPAFERDIATWASIQATWVANEQEVTSLFLPPSEKGKHARALMHQISLNEVPGTVPRPSRYGTKIQIKGVGGILTPSSDPSATCSVNVDAVFNFKIIDLDHAFISVEYLREEVASANVLASLSSDLPFESSNALDKSNHSQNGSELTQSWLDLDQLSDLGDMDDLLDLLASCP